MSHRSLRKSKQWWRVSILFRVQPVNGKRLTPRQGPRPGDRRERADEQADPAATLRQDLPIGDGWTGEALSEPEVPAEF